MLVSEHKDSLRQHLISFADSLDYYRKMNPEMGVGPIVDGYIKNELDMEAGMRQYYDGVKEVQRRNDRLLKAIRAVKGKTFCKHLTALIEDCEAVDWAQWEIVKEPVGKCYELNEYGRELTKRWVDQRAVGTEGDSWEGTICVQLKPNKYLKFHFSM